MPIVATLTKPTIPGCAVHAKARTAAVVRDPVCGMTVDPRCREADMRPRWPRCSISAAHRAGTNSSRRRSEFVDSDRSRLRHERRARDAPGISCATRASGFYFCSAGCKGKFEAAPEKYLGDRPAPEPMPKGTQYTCPMHPEIVRDKPGLLPDLRHGAGADGRADRRRGAKSGADRFHAAALGRRARCRSRCW